MEDAQNNLTQHAPRTDAPVEPEPLCTRARVQLRKRGTGDAQKATVPSTEGRDQAPPPPRGPAPATVRPTRHSDFAPPPHGRGARRARGSGISRHFTDRGAELSEVGAAEVTQAASSDSTSSYASATWASV